MKRLSLAASRLLARIFPSRIIESNKIRRVTPVSRQFGLDRGLPIDRYYIEEFLARNARRIAGSVLEIGDRVYTKKFGTGVTISDVLSPVPGDGNANIIGDLESGVGVPHSKYDCIVLTQVLQFIYMPESAIVACHRALKPGGCVLATVGGISQISRYDMDRWGDYWRFTDLSSRRMFESKFGQGRVTTDSFGNVLAACAFLNGLAAHEVRRTELEIRDPDYQLIIAICATKAY